MGEIILNTRQIWSRL